MKAELQALFSAAQDRPFCLRQLADEPISLSRFRHDLSVMGDQLRSHGAETYLLVCHDAYLFTVGLLALAGLQKKIIICANTKPHWIEQIADDIEAILSDVELPLPGKRRLGFDLDRQPSGHWEPPISGEETLVFFTSGSTAAPKPIEKRLGRLLTEVSHLEKQFGPGSEIDLVAGSVPHHHFYGLIFRVLWPLCTGRLWLAEQVGYQEQLFPIGKAFQAVQFVASPAFLARLDTGLQTVPLKRVFSAGSLLSFTAAQDSLRQLGQLPIEIYGSTETGVIGYRQQRRGGETWRPLEAIVLAEGEDGVDLKSPFLESDSPLRLDDRLTLQEDGCFELLGRRDRVVKVADHRVSLGEIEQAMEAFPEVRHCLAFPLPDNSDVLACMVVLQNIGVGEEAAAERIKHWRLALRQRLHDVTVPKKWRIVEEIPLNSMGKTDWDLVRAWFARPRQSVGLHLPAVIASRPMERGGRLEILINPGLNVFRGHFDAAPVVPGVVQLLWVISLARQYFPELLDQRSEALHSVKYHNIMQPGDIIELTLSLREGSLKEESLEFVYGSASKRYSSGRYRLDPV